MRPALINRTSVTPALRLGDEVVGRSRTLRAIVLVGVPLVVGLWHVWVVAEHYFVGSFDDDASYLLAAQALLHGAGLTGHLTSGVSVVAAYPPGYSFLLVPLLWIWPHGFTPERISSAVLFASVFPLLWIYLGRRGVGDAVRFGALVLLALNPVLATFGSMVMAEMAFVALLMVLLLIVERWDHDAAVFGARGIAVIVAGAALVWLKEAGIGFVLGLAIWYLIRRDWRKGAAVVGGCVVLLMPVVIARALSGVPLAGSRYSLELGGYYSGGLLGRVIHVAPEALWTLFSTALPASVVPGGAPLPLTGVWASLILILGWQAGIFTVIGLGVSLRRHRDVTVVAVPVYVAETLLWPFINERRLILVLPLLLGWYSLGVVTTSRWFLRSGAARLSGAPRLSRAPRLSGALERVARPVVLRGAAVATLGGAIIVYPLVVQFPRDYLFDIDVSSSHPQGSRYQSVLSAVGHPSTVVETDYESTTALFSGHLTANTAFQDATATVCDLGITTAALEADHAGFLLLAAVNKPQVIDNACLQSQATSTLPAVRLLRTDLDQASVFELIGSGTAHPGLSDLVATATLVGSGATSTASDDPLARGDYPGTSTVIAPVDGIGTLTWYWGTDDPLAQVSVGEVKMLHGGQLAGATLEILDARRRWTPVVEAPGVVGDTGAPYLLDELPAGSRADAMRLVVRADRPVVVTDIHALGSTVGGR